MSRENLNVNLGINSLPDTLESFTALRDKLSSTPQGGAACFVVANAIYVTNKDLGLQCITLCTDIYHIGDAPPNSVNVKGKIINKSKQMDLDMRVFSKPFLARSYFDGANPDNNYTPNTPLSISIYRQPIDTEQNNRLKLFVVCGGADTARPITLSKNSAGIWKAYEFSSLQVGCRPPNVKVDDGDDL